MFSGSLQYVVPAPPDLGGALQISPGIKWLRLPLPFKLDHINLWLLEDGVGWMLVDTGMNDQATRDLWDGPLLAHLEGKPVTRILCTHMHPDHMGLAGYLSPMFGAEVWASLADWSFGRLLARDGGDDFNAVHIDFFQRAGLAGPDLDMIRERGNSYAKRAMAPPPSFRRLLDGANLSINGESWELIEGNGHSPEHMCLFNQDRNILISGDQILPKISPIVGVWPQEPMADPLDLYMKSLDRFDPLPDDVLVLPSHGLPFTGLKIRLAQLRSHHEQRLDDTRRATQEPATARHVLSQLFPRVSEPNDVVFACTETIAHLHRLMATGEIRRESGPDGIDRYMRN
ncbi:MAG: MBL fold metallo-hydrolase [Alphaproteobacteria bacterium]|nr:MBL fold metallo-hydrolase [Alphaproteobacteria bacterium]